MEFIEKIGSLRSSFPHYFSQVVPYKPCCYAIIKNDPFNPTARSLPPQIATAIRRGMNCRHSFGIIHLKKQNLGGEKLRNNRLPRHTPKRDNQAVRVLADKQGVCQSSSVKK